MPDTGADDFTPNVSRLDFSVMDDAVGYRLRRAQLAVFQHFNEAFSSKGLRPTDFAVLLLLTRNEGSKQSEVAEALGIQRANFVAIVDGLENKGFIERRKSESDRRVQSLYMTPAGQDYLEELMPIWLGHEQWVLNQLGGVAERDMVNKLLARLYE